MTVTSPRATAIITGSSSGIGRATAIELARSGWNLVVHGLRNEQELSAIVKEVHAAGGEAVACSGDVSDPAVLQALADAALDTFGRIDGIVNNAGAGATKGFDEVSDQDWQRLFDTHLLAAARLLRITQPHLLESGGAVVNVSSLAANRGLQGRTAYGAIKAGVEGLTAQLACEWAPYGVRVNAVAPGTILTPLVETNFKQGLLDEEGILGRTPLRRFGQPEEIATVIRFLLSSDSSYVTGQTIRVDGGWSVWGGWT